MMKLPEMTPVQSSNVASVGYEDATLTVFVQFLNGTIYIYKGVPQFEFENLKTAASVGSYLHRNFKNIYAYERIM
ncbi:MAG: KTSC domain-containing protein [Melioribacteraceae bacterium]